MGIHNNISIDKFPEQGPNLHKRVSVCFHFEVDKRMTGTCIRDDYQEPFITIFRLDDNRVVLSTECQYCWLEV